MDVLEAADCFRTSVQALLRDADFSLAYRLTMFRITASPAPLAADRMKLGFIRVTQLSERELQGDPSDPLVWRGRVKETQRQPRRNHVRQAPLPGAQSRRARSKARDPGSAPEAATQEADEADAVQEDSQGALSDALSMSLEAEEPESSEHDPDVLLDGMFADLVEQQQKATLRPSPPDPGSDDCSSSSSSSSNTSCSACDGEGGDSSSVDGSLMSEALAAAVSEAEGLESESGSLAGSCENQSVDEDGDQDVAQSGQEEEYEDEELAAAAEDAEAVRLVRAAAIPEDVFRLDAAVGELHFSISGSFLRAHCMRHGPACRRRRTITESDSAARQGQGRPVGLLVSWLLRADEVATAREHVAMAVSPYEQRLAARSHFYSLPGGREFGDHRERPRRAGEEEEPTSIP